MHEICPLIYLQQTLFSIPRTRVNQSFMFYRYKSLLITFITFLGAYCTPLWCVWERCWYDNKTEMSRCVAKWKYLIVVHHYICIVNYKSILHGDWKKRTMSYVVYFRPEHSQTKLHSSILSKFSPKWTNFNTESFLVLGFLPTHLCLDWTGPVQEPELFEI